jgi:hypothetical protein
MGIARKAPLPPRYLLPWTRRYCSMPMMNCASKTNCGAQLAAYRQIVEVVEAADLT